MRFPLGPRYRISVNQETITKAIETDSSRCWIAESIKAHIPNATGVIVDLATTRLTDPEKGLRYVYLTPYSAQLALLAFDEGTPPNPFSFILKNAHVTRAGQTLATKKRYEQTKAAQNEKRRDERKMARNLKLKTAKIASSSLGGATIPRRVGGRRPPQLRMLRQFGVRAFRGASLKRAAAIQSS